ncbi:UDP-N-acetylmuramate dehydrogenase [Acidiphilium sp. AL]|uniref:UDP-N-acetylenolpyruvoylglucosamine reductase n=2 Tax=Acidocellaceae TaxID=3385905 RepID=A0ABS9DV01_9PROT|nr:MULTISPECIES: UDP-N-acetylmuramate dehydrogenase [Acidiphilium]MCF3945536.1 UDP-N-acetylmuramate dehydrogenase [Acidiphilium iwatense]MCU4159659.1 UDP-N-acetylmuramate dehydrogenase [Acidiphilium sp. AL]
MAVEARTDWRDALPAVRGRIGFDATLGRTTWFRVGGAAEVLFRPADAEDLATFLRDVPPELPVTVIGAASNLIIRDGGIPGVVVKLARGFGDVVVEADGVIAGAASLDAAIAEHAASANLTGLEFLSGIPGSLGGAVAMNAGAYGSEIRAVLDWAEIIGRDGTIARYTEADLALSYRHASLPPGGVVVRVRLHARLGDPAAIAATMAKIKTSREATQPVRARTGGSTFRNPEGHKAWQLIDQAGCRGMVVGNAQVSEMHCNFLINRGGATADDLESLGEAVRARVLAETGIALIWEIKRIGIPGRGAP